MFRVTCSTLTALLACCCVFLGACEEPSETPPTPDPAPTEPAPDAGATDNGASEPAEPEPAEAEPMDLAGTWRMERALLMDALLDHLRRTDPRRWELVQRGGSAKMALEFFADAVEIEIAFDAEGRFELTYQVPTDEYGPGMPDAVRTIVEFGRWAVTADELTMLTEIRDGSPLVAPEGRVTPVSIEDDRLWVEIRHGIPPRPLYPLERAD